MGGEGSDTYEYQNVAPGVIFAPVGAKWWVYENGADPRRSVDREPLHRFYPDPNDESYWDMYVGAEPRSAAGVVDRLGGEFAWIPDMARYQMLDRDGVALDYVRIESD
jgi:hypothetical protein